MRRLLTILLLFLLASALSACGGVEEPTPTATILAPPPSPTAAFEDVMGLGGYPLVTTEQVGDIPAGARVRISHGQLGLDTWEYVVVAEDEQTSANARQDQLAYAPDVTPDAPQPTAIFGDYIGTGGYPLVTTEQVGDIPAGARVRISHGIPQYNGWAYFVVMEDEETTAEAREDQLTYAPDVTPGAPTPIGTYMNFIGVGGYPLVTTEEVGGIPAGTRVRITVGQPQYNGWVYQIIGPDEETIGEARDHQLRLAPDVTPGAPTPNSN